MAINNIMSEELSFKRVIDLEKYNSSLFLFGPRMTGKTTIIRSMKSDLYIDY